MIKRKKQIRTPDGNTLNLEDFEPYYKMINNTILEVYKNTNNMLPGEIKRYLISIKQQSMLILSK